MRPLRITKKKYLSYFSILKLTRPGYGIHLERLRTVIIKASMVLIKKNALNLQIIYLYIFSRDSA